MAKEKFLIDSNSIITPYNSYYSFDISIKFWEQLKAKINDGSIIILDLVKDEILKGEDDLSNWFNNLGISTCISHKEPNIISKYAEILQFIQQNSCYKESALKEWAQEHIADAWLIATASVYNYTLITFERKQFETAHSNYHTNNNDNIKNLKKETINKTRTTFNQKLNKKNNVKNDNQNKSKSRSISKPKKITINLFNDKNNKLLTQESSSNKDNNKKNYKKYILNDIKPKSKNTNNNAQNKKKEILIVNQKKSSNKNESLEKKEKSKLSKINKFINILSKSKEDFSHMIKNKKKDINKKNKNYLTNRIKTHHSDVHKNKNVSKNKSLKFATIRLSNSYQNNKKMKEKVRNNYLIEKGKTSTDMNSINNAIKNKPNNNLITDKNTV